MADTGSRRPGWRHYALAMAGAAAGLAVPAGAGAQEAQPAARSVETVFVSSARKTEERSIDVPVSTAGLSEEQIERYNTTNLTQLSSQIPGVVINHASGGGAGGNMTIRGIGNIATDYGAEQPVALVLDGFSFTRGHIIDVGFFDLESVEVLKGPQTLYFGKNSPAGVIAVRSISPGDEFEGFVRVSYEFRTEDPTIEGAVSVPVSDKFKFRLAGRGQFMQGGYLKNTAADVVRNLGPLETDALYPTNTPSYKDYPGQKQAVGRFTAVFTPNDAFDATLKVFGSRSARNDAGAVGLHACADGVGGHPWLFTALFGLIEDTAQTCSGRIEWERNGARAPTKILDADPFREADEPTYYRTKNLLTTLEMNWDIGDVTLTSVTGYWKYKHREHTNYDYTNFAVVTSRQGESGETWATEFRARSDFDFPLNFMVGVFYEDMNRDLDAPVQIFPLGPAESTGPWPDLYDGSFLTYHQHWDNKIKSFSVFGELRWQIFETLELSGGVRYTDEKRRTFGGQIFDRLDTVFGPFSPFAPSGTFYNLSRDFNNTSPSATLSWKPVDDTLIYVAYKSGFQAAGISNPGTVGNFETCLVGCPKTAEQVNDILTFDGSKVEGFEIGAKGLFLDGRLTADIALYRMKYKSLQVAVFNPVTTTFTIQNAAAAVNKGIEGSLTFQATDELQLRMAAQYNDLKFASFTDAECYPGQANPAAATYRPELASLCVGGTQDLSGQHYGGPPFQLNVGFTYDMPIANGWYGMLTGDVIHFNRGRETLRQPDTAIPARTILNLSLRVYQSDGPWEFSVICSNCANERYVYFIGNKPLAKTGDLTSQLGVPRLITLQTTYRW
jgi:iron complex outermembrane receptor protein